MTPKTKWEEMAANRIRAELDAHDLNMNDLAKRLTESGMVISHKAVRMKVMRGKFSAAFMLQCLDVIGSSTLDAS